GRIQLGCFLQRNVFGSDFVTGEKFMLLCRVTFLREEFATPTIARQMPRSVARVEYKDPGYLSEDESSLDGNNNLGNSQQGNVNQVEGRDVEEVSDTIFEVSPQAPRVDVHEVNKKENSHHSDSPFAHLEVSQDEPPTAKGSSSKSYPKASCFSQASPDGMIKVGRYMGYDMEGCSKDIEQIIRLQREADAVQLVIRVAFFVFGMVDVSISDNFIALYGIWLPTNSKILIVVIYAPQSFGLKRILWDHISGLITRWNGETIVLGDFNEVKMEGYSFTWSHSSASKMSKLDRFLVLEGIFVSFPTISAICLDRHLSDHCPILLNEIHTDYGPTPFRVYHSWFKRDGFDALVENAESNASQVGAKKVILDDLVIIDKNLDKGMVSDELLAKRMDLSRKLHDLKQMELKDAVQKAKVYWAIEGDENSKFLMESLTRDDISIDEIRKAMWDCGESKSPGLDGFTFEFFRRYWHFIGLDFCAVINCFFDKGRFPRGSNSSFIALIPKVAKSCKLLPNILELWWKVKTLSIGGRLTLLKSVLGAVPIYNMSLYKAPKCVLHELERLRNNFFKGGDSQDSKITWVTWAKKAGTFVISMATVHIGLKIFVPS
nr:RNA-directed DNA polymerase, eukaryota [Tanacetum cinerariifolium]